MADVDESVEGFCVNAPSAENFVERSLLMCQSAVQSMATARESSVTSKKQLARTTKEFRQSNSVDLSSFKSLLKAYQREIDALSKRCGDSDGYYLDLYEKMKNAKDADAAKDTDATKVRAEDGGEVEAMKREMEKMREELVQLEGFKDMSVQLEETKLELKRVGGEKEAMAAEISSLTASRDEITATAKTEIERLIGVRDELVIDNEKMKRKMNANVGKGKDEEIARLQKEVEEYEEEFKGLKDQDLTIKQLQKQIKQQNENFLVEIEKRIEEGIKDGLDEGEEKVKEVMDREAEWMRKCESLELALRAERVGRHASDTNLISGIQSQGDREEAFEQQKKILLGETERLMEELYIVGKERDELKLKVEADVKTAKTTDIADTILNSNFENERTALMNEIAEANGTLEQVRKEGKRKEEKLEKNATMLKQELSLARSKVKEVSDELESMRGELRALPSKEEVGKMRKELSILKQVNFNGGGDEDVEEGVESVLVKRLRKVEGDLIGVQRVSNEKDTEVEMLLKGTSTLENENEKLLKLVERLESDVVALQRGEVGGTHGEGEVLRSILEKDSSTGTPRSNVVKVPSTPLSGTGLGASAVLSPSNQMTTILMAQRDRLQEKVSSLEQTRDGLRKELANALRTNETVKQQNEKLYERLRYAGSGEGETTDIGDVRDLEEGFEKKHDPFKEFAQREKRRRLAKLGPVEKIVYMVARLVLGNKTGRNGLVVYVVLLHFLIFITTYHWAHEKTCSGLDLLHPDLHDHETITHIHGGVPEIADHLKLSKE